MGNKLHLAIHQFSMDEIPFWFLFLFLRTILSFSVVLGNANRNIILLFLVSHGCGAISMCLRLYSVRVCESSRGFCCAKCVVMPLSKCDMSTYVRICLLDGWGEATVAHIAVWSSPPTPNSHTQTNTQSHSRWYAIRFSKFNFTVSHSIHMHTHIKSAQCLSISTF